MSRKMKYRGMAARVRAIVLDKFADGRPFTSEDIRAKMLVDRSGRRAVQNALAYLAHQHMLNEGFTLEKVAYGTYRATGPAVEAHSTNERKLLDDLLTAMAAAEPVLKKCARLMDAVHAMQENGK